MIGSLARTSAIVCVLCMATSIVAAEPAENRSTHAAALLPESTAIYAELPDPGGLTDVLVEHPVAEQLLALDLYQQALQGPQLRELQAVVTAVEGQLGMAWHEALAAVTDGGVVLAVDAPTGGVAILSRARDPKQLQSIIDTLVKLAKADAEGKGNADSVVSETYRSLPVYQLNETRLALLGEWLLMTNRNALGQKIADRYLDQQQGESLEQNARFQTARSQADEASAWAFVDLEGLREAGAAKELFEGRADNPLGELLVGGLLTTLQHAPYATASLNVAADQARLSLSMPHNPAWVGEARKYYFGQDGLATAPAPVELPDQLLQLTTYRDLSQMWLHAPDLFDQNVNAQLAQADSNLATLFGGRDFGEQILGAFHPEIRFVLVRQEFGEDQIRPAIRLPAGALVFQLKDPELMQPELRRTFQSLIGFLNVVGAMNAQPQLDLDMEKSEDSQLVTARYIPTAADKASEGARIHFNFSPSVAFSGSWFVLASSEQLAQSLLKKAGSAAAESATTATQPNTRVVLDTQTLSQVLDDNRQQLVAQNMLSEGHDQQTAESHVDALLRLMQMADQVALTLETGADQVRLEIGMTFSKPSNEERAEHGD